VRARFRNESRLQTTQGMDEPTVILRAEQTLTIQDWCDVMSMGALQIRMVCLRANFLKGIDNLFLYINA
jgi:hypothetical protein